MLSCGHTRERKWQGALAEIEKVCGHGTKTGSQLS